MPAMGDSDEAGEADERSGMCWHIGWQQLAGDYMLYVPRGGRKTKTEKRRTSAPVRKTKYVRTFFRNFHQGNIFSEENFFDFCFFRPFYCVV
jgi:hypothetical protein